ncbi:hypothetical protein [Microbacterium sp. KR10-403]|uniref:hypothetical protein n=1 Tax=Microbacterium sp. KR10-403 TaxID=3158581 RepID=UPI0032E4F343
MGSPPICLDAPTRCCRSRTTPFARARAVHRRRAVVEQPRCLSPPDLQVRIDGPDDAFYVVDIDAEQWRAEFDGNGKYLDSDLRNGALIEQVILAEKKREDWIRARTDRVTVHLADEHVRTVDACVRRLAEYGIPPPRRRPSPDPGPPAPDC